MPVLRPTEIYGVAQYIGVNTDRKSGLQSTARESVRATFDGFEGDCHGGATRPACSRVRLQYERGVQIRNVRQLTILSVEELAQVAEAMGLPEALKPQWVGANLVLEGVPELSALPPGSRLIFENGAALAVDMENGPCRFPGEVIEEFHPGKGKFFPKHALGKRGVTGWVEREGEIKLGERARLHLPPERMYTHA